MPMTVRSAARGTLRRCSRHSQPSRERAHRQAAQPEPARFPEMTADTAQNYYEKLKPRIHRRIGQEVRLAYRVLDLGCGSCDLVRYLAESYRQEVTGVDISDGSFPSRRHTGDGGHYHCLKQDAAHLSFAKDASADAIVSMWAMHEMAKPEAILSEAHRILRPGGKIFIVDFPRDSIAQRLWNEDYYRPGDIESLLQNAGFEQVQGRVIEQGQVMWSRGCRPPSSKGES